MAAEGEETVGHVCNYQEFGGKFKKIVKRLFTWPVIKPILYGQGLSLLLCGTAVTTTYLIEDYNANVPLTQSLCNYVILLLVYGTLLLIQKNENNRRLLPEALKSFWWQYLIISMADVGGNYLIVSAYQYTSLTSVQVLDCFVILVVMGLSWFILKTRYKIIHFAGVAIALLGVAVMIVADVLLGKGGTGPNPLLGDVMVLGAATCYGISNVGMEYAVKRRPAGQMEILGMFGLFGSIITGILLACLEREALSQIKWSPMTYALFLGFALCMFLLYTLMPRAMKLSSATTVNLSILTADLYALFAGLFLFGYQFTPLYIVSFIVITLSLIIYNWTPPGSANPSEVPAELPLDDGVDDTNRNSAATSDASRTYLLNDSTKTCKITCFSRKRYWDSEQNRIVQVDIA